MDGAPHFWTAAGAPLTCGSRPPAPFLKQVCILGPERASERYEKSHNVFNINTPDKGTQRGEGAAASGRLRDHPRRTLSACSCVTGSQRAISTYVGYYEDLNNAGERRKAPRNGTVRGNCGRGRAGFTFTRRKEITGNGLGKGAGWGHWWAEANAGAGTLCASSSAMNNCKSRSSNSKRELTPTRVGTSIQR